MRAELAAGDPLQRWWRPLYGLELTLECAALAIVIIRDLWGGDTTVLAATTQATALLLGLGPALRRARGLRAGPLAREGSDHHRPTCAFSH